MNAPVARVRCRVKGTGIYTDTLASAFGTGAIEYDAAGQGRRARTWRVSGSGPNAALQYSAPIMRDRARDQVRKNALAESAVSAIEANVVGTGIVPQFATSDAGLNRELAQLFLDWTDESDADGLCDWYGQQALATRSLAESGETFARFRFRRPGDLETVPLQVQLLEAEYVPYDMPVAGYGQDIRCGIEFNGIGKRAAYWMYKQHPNDIIAPGIFPDRIPYRVPASEVAHLYWAKRPGAIRGDTWLARMLIKARDVDLYDDAELTRKQMAAMFAGFVTKTGDGAFMGEDEEPDSAGVALAPLEPGTLQVLEPDESIEFSEPADVGGAYESFMRVQHRLLAASAGVMYEQITGDYSTGNDRTFRAAVLEFRRRAKMWQHHILVFQFGRPLILRWLDTARAAGIIVPPKAMQARDFRRVKWVPQGWQYINPVQEVQAEQASVRSGFTSRDAVISERGDDPEEVDRQIAEGNRRADAANLVFDSDPRKVNISGAKQQGGTSADQGAPND